MKDSDPNDEEKLNDIVCEAMQGLYDKYVSAATADLLINISWQNRKCFSDAYRGNLAKKVIDDMVPPMEAAATDISRLLIDSRIRFRNDPVFTELAVEVSNALDDDDYVE